MIKLGSMLLGLLIAACAVDGTAGAVDSTCDIIADDVRCATDDDCFANMCAVGACDAVAHKCVMTPRPAGTICIQWSTSLARHVAGHCGDCACVDDITPREEGPSS